MCCLLSKVLPFAGAWRLVDFVPRSSVQILVVAVAVVIVVPSVRSLVIVVIVGPLPLAILLSLFLTIFLILARAVRRAGYANDSLKAIASAQSVQGNCSGSNADIAVGVLIVLQ